MSRYRISGGTYPHRKAIAAAGGRWDGASKSWTIETAVPDADTLRGVLGGLHGTEITRLDSPAAPAGLYPTPLPAAPSVAAEPTVAPVAAYNVTPFTAPASVAAPALTEIRPMIGSLLADASPEAMGGLTAWDGAGKARHTLLAEVLAEGELPSSLLPPRKSAVAHLGTAIAPVNHAGFIARRAKAGERANAARTWAARWAIVRVDASNATVGDDAGNVVLTVELDRASDALRFEGDAVLASEIRARFEALREGEVHEAADVTGWVARLLRNQAGAVEFGALGWFIPAGGRPFAEALLGPLSRRWGAKWPKPLLISIPTGDELRIAIAHGLDAEVDQVAHELEESRRIVREESPSLSEIRPGRAASLLKDLSEVQDRLAAYRILCGDDVIRPVAAKIAGLAGTLSGIAGAAAQRFALLELDVEPVTAAPVAAPPTIAERAADAALDAKRAAAPVKAPVLVTPPAVKEPAPSQVECECGICPRCETAIRGELLEWD